MELLQEARLVEYLLYNTAHRNGWSVKWTMSVRVRSYCSSVTITLTGQRSWARNVILEVVYFPPFLPHLLPLPLPFPPPSPPLFLPHLLPLPLPFPPPSPPSSYLTCSPSLSPSLPTSLAPPPSPLSPSPLPLSPYLTRSLPLPLLLPYQPN